MESLDAATFDFLMESAAELNDLLLPRSQRRLTPSRILVLALVSVTSDRPEMRRMARAVREQSRYEEDIRRVHVSRRMYGILMDLHEMGLLRRQVLASGRSRFTLPPRVRARMRPYLQRARELAYCTTSQE